MSPSDRCDAAGLKGLVELRRITRQSDQTLINWSKNKPELFEIVVVGAGQMKKQKINACRQANKIATERGIFDLAEGLQSSKAMEILEENPEWKEFLEWGDEKRWIDDRYYPNPDHGFTWR